MIAQNIVRWVPESWTSNSKCPTPIRAETVSRHNEVMTPGRTKTLSTGHMGAMWWRHSSSTRAWIRALHRAAATAAAAFGAGAPPLRSPISHITVEKSTCCIYVFWYLSALLFSRPHLALMLQCCVRLSSVRNVLWLNGASYSKSYYWEPIWSYYKKSIGTKMSDLDLCLEVV